MIRIALGITSLVMLAACTEEGQFNDLDSKMSQFREQPQGRVEPLPSYPPAERFNYASLAMRSPFDPPVVVSADGNISTDAVPAPDQARPREPLELVSYSALSMVGTLSKDSQIWALINDGKGRVHRVTKGNFLGRNFGEITGISGLEIEVLETVPDGTGGWINRPRTLVINQN